MKKVDLLVLLTYVALVACASCLTLLLPLNATSKQSLLLILCSYVCLSVVSLVILVLLVICFTTNKQAGSNRLHRLRMMEAEIAAGNQKKMTHSEIKHAFSYEELDLWQKLNEQDAANYNKPDPSLLESHHHQHKENHNV